MTRKRRYDAFDYKIGQEAFYHDSGEIYRVKVQEANGTSEKEAYTLEVLEVVQESTVFVPSSIGEKINCEKMRNVSCSGLWHLLDN